jgi:hypothetical protein
MSSAAYTLIFYPVGLCLSSTPGAGIKKNAVALPFVLLRGFQMFCLTGRRLIPWKSTISLWIAVLLFNTIQGFLMRYRRLLLVS